MTANMVALWYLAASVCFILALKGLSHPETARRGNYLGMAGMTIAVLTTLSVISWDRIGLILGVMVVGGAIGAYVSRRVEMTQMPELVAAMHSLVGMAAVLIAVAVVNNPKAFGMTLPIPMGNRLELFIGTFVGAITFSGSIIAFGKLAGLGKSFRLFSSAPVVFKGQHMVNLALAIVMIGFGVAFFTATDEGWTPFLIMMGIAFVLGVLIIIPIGGADMPVVISMLNSYSGWAAAGIGF
ncbi:MAG TPA: NAD(P)(+) transhydrogenase (Re/Si-specific) subunit beta, partial [Burkholderiales bacterium]|nr:NAD(P)(+) transhydrogenase (Re/Si-specific) subunit beta [Burkholderiales bacterium]